MRSGIIILFVIVVGLSVTVISSARAQGLSLVRDAEIEDTIRRMSTPLFRAAGLIPESVSIHLVNDKALNAFVADGQRMFIHTGLLTSADNVGQVIGVIAHETGHISGGHLSRIGRARDAGTATTLLATILGAATAIGTGRGDVGAAVIAGGTHVAQRGFLSFSRSQEGSADQAALTFLDATEQSAVGLLEFMKLLEGQELLISASQDPYARTHPLSEDRIKAISAHIAISPYSDRKPAPELEMAFDRVRAKLFGYFNQPTLTMRQYPPSDQSVAAKYARAFAYSRSGDTQKALKELNELLQTLPDDPYFLELKGQVLFESGNIPDAIPVFRRSAELLPKQPLIRREFARLLIESAEPENLKEAITHLEASLARDKIAASSWRLLGIAHGKLGNIGLSSLALAEEALILGRPSEVKFHAGKAAELFPRGSNEWLHAEDLLLAVKNLEN